MNIFNKIIKVDNLNFEVDLSFFENIMFWTNNNFSPKLINTFGDIPKNNILKQNCHCTYECALSYNVLSNWRYQPSLVRSIIKK